LTLSRDDNESVLREWCTVILKGVASGMVKIKGKSLFPREEELLSVRVWNIGFHDLIREETSSLFMLLG